jgi:hypothetical protein
MRNISVQRILIRYVWKKQFVSQEQAHWRYTTSYE